MADSYYLIPFLRNTNSRKVNKYEVQKPTLISSATKTIIWIDVSNKNVGWDHSVSEYQDEVDSFDSCGVPLHVSLEVVQI